MMCRLVEMREKQVVCIKDGAILGLVSDIEIDTESGKLLYIIVYGRKHGLGILGRDNDYRIPWENIEVIGEDSVLVNCDSLPVTPKRNGGFLSNILSSK